MRNPKSSLTNLSLPFKLPELRVTPSSTHLFMFSASTWNRHLVHYSKDQALLEGHADVVVHRGLLGNYLARLVGEWVQDQGELSTLTWKVVKSTYPKIELLCTGQAIQWENSGHQQLLKCDLKIENSNHEMIVSGEARLRIFSI